MATKFHKIFSGQQPPEVVEWWVNKCFEDHIYPYYHGTDDKDSGGPWNFSLLTIRTPQVAASPRTFYCNFN